MRSRATLHRPPEIGETKVQYIRTPQEAEQNAAARMRELGFPDARVTSGGADGGIDVRSSNALAQVKWRGGLTGRPALQNLYGARGIETSKRLLFFSAADYSQHAMEYAEQTGIALFIYDPDGRVTARNRHASVLVWRPAPGGHRPSILDDFRDVSRSLGVTSNKRGRWSLTVWPFLKTHWRIVGAVFCSLSFFAGISMIISPDVGVARSDGLPSLLVGLIGAPLFWRLYFMKRQT